MRRSLPFVVVGVVIISMLTLNLRVLISALSPIVDWVTVDIELTVADLSVLGSIAPACFAVFGLLAPMLIRRLGLDWSGILALGVLAISHVLRAAADTAPMLIAASFIGLAACGIGNVILPGLVKRWFPRHIPLMTAVMGAMYATSVGMGSGVTQLIAAELGWRLALGSWALLAVVSILTWLPVAITLQRRRGRAVAPEELEPPGPKPSLAVLVRSPLAWGIAGIMGTGTFSVYALFAWLPQILQERSGVGIEEAGLLLTFYGLMGIVINVATVVFGWLRHATIGFTIAGITTQAIGTLGLLLAPEAATVLWVALLGLGPFLQQVSLILFGERARDEGETVALAGFVQAIGFSVATLGPICFGWLHSVSGDWSSALWLMLGTQAIAVVSMLGLRYPTIHDRQIPRERLVDSATDQGEGAANRPAP